MIRIVVNAAQRRVSALALALASAMIACVIGPVWPTPAFAEEVSMDAARLAHELDRLSSTLRVLYIAAHPDDENTRLLAYLANSRHVTAQYLSMTRGGGGQNLIGGEQDTLLDVLRTQELLAARALDGATQRFSSMRDFGYSKSAAETLALWGHEEALADVVYAVRSFRPDVIITRFNELPPNHGHHTASAVLAREAFTAAADAQRFPEQLAHGVSVWQAKRLLHNLPAWQKDAIPSTALTLDVGGYDARLGLSYGELAARSRSQHKSQGFGATPERGALIEHFVVLAGEPTSSDILAGIEPSWGARYPAGAPVDAALGEARKLLHRDHPERASTALAQARRALSTLPSDDPRVQQARIQAERLALLTSGVFVRATAARPSCIPAGALPVRVELLVRRPSELRVLRVRFPDGTEQKLDAKLSPTEKRELTADVRCAADAAPSTPYWLVEPALPGRQHIAEQRLLDDPAGRAPLTATVDFELAGQTLSLSTDLLYTYTDRVQGERERRVAIVPPFTVTPERTAVMFPNGAKASVRLRVRAGADAQTGRVSLQLPSGYRSEPEQRVVTLAHAGDETIVEFKLTPPEGALTRGHARGPEEAQPSVEVAGRHWSLREDIIDYPHVPAQLVLQPARIRLSPVALTKPQGLIGYVEGSGDSIAADLAHIGASVVTLSDRELLQADLSRFSAIVLGVRSYNTRDVLRSAQARLFEYVKHGGTLLTQYVTRSSISPLDVPIGPYPLDVGRGRVTDEHAAVKPLLPDHPVLQTPQRIGPTDFEGWVQERGLYFGEHWDAHYQSVIELADTGEPAERGALLVAPYGRGRYIYTGLSFFRQLPAGVPGAYRLFVNLLAPVGHTP